VIPDKKALKKLKRKYSNLPDDRGVGLIKKLLLSYLPGWFVVWVLRKYFVKSDYKAARESIKFFQLSNRAYGVGKARNNQRLLMIALKLLGDRLPQSFVSLLSSATTRTLKDPTTRNSLAKSILQATKDLPVEIFDASSWYQLSRGLFSLGYFRAAWVARENSLDLSISESLDPKASATVLQRGIEAHLERRNFPDAETAIRFSTSKISAGRISEFHEYFLMMQGKFHKEINSKIAADDDGGTVLRQLLRDRTVALIGAGIATENCDIEVDAFETVYRVRFFGFGKTPATGNHGSRCDISNFFSLEKWQDLEWNEELFFVDSLKLIIDRAMGITRMRNTPVAHIDFELPVYRSTAISGVFNLVVALRGTPRMLKLYGFDFYTKLGQYDSRILDFYRRDGWIIGESFMVGEKGDVPIFEISGSFSAHDPVSNFCFAQNLYKAGLFEIEPYGKSILELTPFQYVERLEEMLGDW